MRFVLCALLAHSFVRAAPGPPPVIDHANWMRDLMPLIANATLLDLSIPGTHDSMTFDLGSVVADGAEDIPTNLSYILHDFGNFENIGQFARNQVCGGKTLRRMRRVAPLFKDGLQHVYCRASRKA